MNLKMPHSKESECKLLGAIFHNPLVLKKLDMLDPFDFYDPDRAKLFSLIMDASVLNRPIDVDTIIMNNDAWDLAQKSMLLAEVVEDFILLEHIEPYVATIKEYAKKRRLINESLYLIDVLTKEKDHELALEKAEKIIHGLTQKASTAVVLKDALSRAINGLNSLHKDSHVIKTKFNRLDEVIRGFEPGQLIIIAARPSMGKTALALCLAHNLIKQQIPVGFFTIEMTNEQMALRSLALESEMSMDQLYERSLFENLDRFNRMGKSASYLFTMSLYLDDISRSVQEIRSQARLWKQQGVKAIFIDYLGLIKSPRYRESKNVEVSEISAALKDLSKEVRLPIIVLSQLNRGLEHRSDQKPRLSDLRDSGAIEQDADIIMFLYRESYYNPEADLREAELIIQKNRNGKLDTLRLTFEPTLMRFS